MNNLKISHVFLVAVLANLVADAIYHAACAAWKHHSGRM